MIAEELDTAAIRARVEAATPGPWEVEEIPETGDSRVIFGNEDALTVWPITFGGSTHAEAEFIAHSRTDVPALLAENDRLREQIRVMSPHELICNAAQSMFSRDYGPCNCWKSRAVQTENQEGDRC